jgi:hypothetical protein
MAAVGRRRPPWLGCVFERNIYVGTLCNQRTLRLLCVLRCLKSADHFCPMGARLRHGTIDSFMVL